MAQSNANACFKQMLRLRPSSAFYLLNQFSLWKNMARFFSEQRPAGSVTSYPHHFRYSNRCGNGVCNVSALGSDLLVRKGTPPIGLQGLTCILNYKGHTISKYSTSTKESKSRIEEQQLLESASPSGARISMIPALGFGALIATVAGYFMYHSSERQGPIEATKPEPAKLNSVLQKSTIGGPFKLTNHKGEVVTDRDFIGDWTLIYFGYTSCPDICPEELQKLAESVAKIEMQTNQKVLPVFVTIDPERDSVAQIRAYIAEFHPRMVGLTGPVDDIRQVAREYRVYYKKVEEEGSDYLVDHSNFIYLMDPTMEFVKFFGREYDSESLAAEVIQETKKRQV